ncbi:MAG: aldo/keto reductase [Aquabacterium sp.]
MRHIGHFTVPAIGLGCMNICHAYGAPPPADVAVRLLREAFDLGVRHFDTAALYGFGTSETLVRQALGDVRGQILLASKGGMAGVTGDDGVTRRVIDNSPAAIQRHCEDSLRRLGTDVIDLYYLHRWDRRTPIEDVVGAMARLVTQGKVRALGLSEVSAATLRRAHAVHPIAALQSEYSLWTREPEIATLAACRETGTTLVAFSPLARAFLTGRLTDVGTLAPKDLRRGMPRFEPQAYAANLALLPAYRVLAEEAGCTPGQLALAWLLAQGDDVLAIPGTTDPAHLRENIAAGALAVPPALLRHAGELIHNWHVQGPRYAAATQAEIDTETF